jgi:hypothetical protein
LERSEACQRGQVAAEPPALGEVERLKRGELRQLGEVTEPDATGEVERSEQGEAGQQGKIAELKAPEEVERSK